MDFYLTENKQSFVSEGVTMETKTTIGHNVTYRNNTIQFDYTYDEELIEAFNFQNVFYSLLIPVIAFIGLLGNIFTLIILWRKPVHPTLTLFLKALVITDIIIIILSLITMSLLAHSLNHADFTYFFYIVYPNIFTTCNFIIMTVQQYNVWITVSMAIERYIAMCHPYATNYFRKKTKAKIFLIISGSISTLYNLPRLFATTTRSYYSDDVKMEVYEIVQTEFGTTFFYKTVFCVWMYAFIVYLIPILIIMFTSLMTVTELMRMRTKVIKARNTEINMSVCVLSVVIVFIICQTPGIFSQIHHLFSPTSIKLFTISNTLFVFNSSINFFIYTAAWRRFRRRLIFVRMLCKVSSENMSRVYVDERKNNYSKENMMAKCPDGFKPTRPNILILSKNDKLVHIKTTLSTSKEYIVKHPKMNSFI